MKKFKFITLTFTLVLIFGFINYPKEFPKVKGYYIDLEGKKTEVTIEVMTKFLSDKMRSIPNQNGIAAFTKAGKKFSINYKNASEYGFSYLNIDYVYQLFPQDLIDKNPNVTNDFRFFRLLQDGYCRVYLMEYISNNNGSTSEVEKYILRKNDELFVSHPGLNKLIYLPGQKTIEVFFSDCPSLLEKIENKDFKRGVEKYFKYAEFYNLNCAKNGSENNTSEEE